MDHLVATTVAQQAFDFTAFVAHDAAGIGAGIGAQAAAHLAARLFDREFDHEQTGFAINETVAHLHLLMARGQVTRQSAKDGVYTYEWA